MILRKYIGLLLCAILTLSACGVRDPQVSEKDILAKGDELHGLAASRTVSVLNEPYLGAVSVPLSATGKVLSRHVSMSFSGTLGEVCTAAAPLTGMAWQIEDGTSDVVRRVRFEGSIEGFCEYLSSLYGYEWQYGQQGILFSAGGTRTFTLLAAPGKVGYKNQITNQNKENNTTSGGGLGQTVNASDISSQTAQSNTTDLTLDVWNEALNTIKSLLTKTGTVTANMASGTVTVSDSAPVLRRVSQFVREYNHKLSRQVALEVRVWQLNINDESDLGLNLQTLFEDQNLLLSTGMTLAGVAKDAAGELAATITGGKLKGSQATLKALSTYGKTTLVTSGSGVTMNNMPLPVQNTTKDTYIAGMSLNTNDYGQTSQITPGEITTGFAMTVIPHILDRRSLILQYNASLTSKDAMREFSNDTVRVEMPTVSTRAFSQRVTMRMGQTLVLAGFEHESHGKDNTIGLLAAGRSGQYGRNLIIITISVESMPGYEQEAQEVARAA